MVQYINHLTFSFVSSDNLFNICYKWQNTPSKLMAEEFGNLPLADKVIPEIKEKFVVDNPNQAVAKLLLHFGEECIARRFTSNRHYDPCERDLGEIRWAEEGKDGYTNDCTLLPIPAQDLELALQLRIWNWRFNSCMGTVKRRKSMIPFSPSIRSGWGKRRLPKSRRKMRKCNAPSMGNTLFPW